jgi:hypothetical protein
MAVQWLWLLWFGCSMVVLHCGASRVVLAAACRRLYVHNPSTIARKHVCVYPLFVYFDQVKSLLYDGRLCFVYLMALSIWQVIG